MTKNQWIKNKFGTDFMNFMFFSNIQGIGLHGFVFPHRRAVWYPLHKANRHFAAGQEIVMPTCLYYNRIMK